ncbi:hypothetical protein F53441_11765 [Fusarium austroafricanum]|uniref:Aquaporin-like protein n=1 Tax=Fusarium austroafricanum TaxID=2364996 RepID=A0A8H4NYK4_9HYPO|nr:hypothetical protein F53441_11765 [Fusarium austroafricanum]
MGITNRRKQSQGGDVEARSSSEPLAAPGPHYECTTQPFAGRLGANQASVVEPITSSDEHLLKHQPDATPHMSFWELMDMRPIKNINLWKAAFIEGVGTLLQVYITIWASTSPDILPVAPSRQLGNFDNAAFLGPLVGGITNIIFVTLFITSFGAVSGAHFNPLITFGTFCARLCSLPRLILYVAAQIGGAALAGLLVRASWGSRDFKVGGCWLFTNIVPPREIFVIELVSSTLLLFLAFGVGLDPRQAKIVGPALGPFLVGLSAGVLSFSSAFTRYGYGGAGLNPARCMGAFVGSRFPGWHWVHWTLQSQITIYMYTFLFLFYNCPQEYIATPSIMSRPKPATESKATVMPPPPPPPDATDRGDFVDSEDEHKFDEVAEDPAHYARGSYYPICIGNVLAGRYRIVHKLDHGGFSVVWMAHDMHCKKDVALKITIPGDS